MRFALRITWLACILLLAAVVSGVGCGADEEAVSTESWRVEYPDLHPLDAEVPSSTSKPIQRLVPGERAAWRVDGAEARYLPFPGSGADDRETALRCTDPEPTMSVTLPGPFDSKAFNRLAIRVRSSGKFRISLEVRTDEKVVRLAEHHPVDPQERTRSLVFEAPGLRQLEGDIQHIVFRIHNLSRALWILSIDLLRQSDLEFLPAPEEGLSPVAIGSEWGNACGVGVGGGVRASVESQRDSRLRFAYGTPEGLVWPGVAARLQLLIRDEEGNESKREFRLRSAPRSARWEHVEIDLSEFGTQSLRFEWSVLPRADEIAPVVALGQVMLLTPGPPRPNVILITSDTHRGDHLGLAGEGVEIRTPHLDALAERGVLFEDCFSTTNVTNPSHISLMTGAHPRDTGIVSNYTRLSSAAPTLAEGFRESGYVTLAAISARHLGGPTSGLGQGFECSSHPLDSPYRSATQTLSRLEAWLERYEGLPVFVWLHLFDAHAPYELKALDPTPYYGPRLGAAYDKELPELDLHAQKAVRRLGLAGVRDLDLPRAFYKAEIDRMDGVLGTLLERPECREAIIAFTGDHGESLGNHRLYFTHSDLYRDTLHVPLILSWPGGPAGIRHVGPVTNLDLGRTLLDLAGLAGQPFPGRNLAQVTTGKRQEPSTRFGLSAHHFEASITRDGWHMQFRLLQTEREAASPVAHLHSVELFYLPEDPDCAQDLSRQESERATRMRADLLQWLARAKDQGWRGEPLQDADRLADLQALGYTDSSSGNSSRIQIDPACDCSWCARFP